MATYTEGRVNTIVEEAFVTAEDGIVRTQDWDSTQQETGRDNLDIDISDYVTATWVNSQITAAINQITIADNIEY